MRFNSFFLHDYIPGPHFLVVLVFFMASSFDRSLLSPHRVLSSALPRTTYLNGLKWDFSTPHADSSLIQEVLILRTMNCRVYLLLCVVIKYPIHIFRY